MYIDTHCHLTFPEFKGDLAMVIGNAKKAGVKQFICPGVDLLSSRQAIELSQKHPHVVFASIGFHPYEAAHTPSVAILSETLRYHSSHIVAIGECGLDYHIYKGEPALGKKQSQKILFDEQLRLALKHNLAVIMHVRDAFDDFFDVLDTLPSLPKGVIHCFSGGLHDLARAKERKLFVGIDGNVTYSKQLATVVPHIPPSMLLLETDAPYLTPVPHRSERNEPKYIPLTARCVAELLGIEEAEIANRTTANARSLFGLS